jgi:hypothetical protein
MVWTERLQGHNAQRRVGEHGTDLAQDLADEPLPHRVLVALRP